MEIIPPVGVTCLGIVIGWLVRYYILRFNTFNVETLASLISILLGAAIIKLFESDNKRLFWFYPIGLLIGFVLYTVLVLIASSHGVDRPGITGF